MMSFLYCNWVIYILVVVVLVILIYLGVESILVVRRVRRLLSRLEYLTDIKEWLFFFKKCTRFFNK